MSQENLSQTNLASTGNKETPQSEKQIFLVSYPKVVFMYPTMIAAFVAGIYMQFFSGGIEQYFVEGEQSGSTFTGLVFLAVFMINMVVISFDFPRTTSLTLFFVFIAIILGGYLIMLNFPNLIPSLTALVTSLQPLADATFYYVIGLIFLFIFFFRLFEYAV